VSILHHAALKLTHVMNKPYLTLQNGVMSTARHSENISCSGVTSTARHAASSHSFVYISTTLGANVIGLLHACSYGSYGVGDSC